MHHDRLRLVHDIGLIIEQAELQVGILAPGEAEAFIEAAEVFQNLLAAEAVGGSELGCFQLLGISIVSLSYFKLMLIDFQFNACGLFVTKSIELLLGFCFWLGKVFDRRDLVLGYVFI